MFQSCLGNVLAYRFHHDIDKNCCDNSNIRSVLKMDPSTGALQIPSYTQISRADHCPLLKHAWGENWDEVVRLCVIQPWRTLHLTKYSGRTALHLATFDRSCPLRVARALLKANRQMIAVRDSNNYTPLHIVAFFSAATTTMGANNHSGSRSQQRVRTTGEAVATNHMGRTTEGVDGAATTSPVAKASASTTDADDEVKRAEAADAEVRSVMSLFCDTAIMVEQELGRARGKQQEEEQLPLLEGTSPLYLAAKKGAPVSILKILLETRSRTNCIAPSTGGESYWYENNSKSDTATGANWRSGDGAKEKKAAPASFSSPLEILLREDRLRSSMNSSYYRNDVYLLGEEEDGNMFGVGRIRNNSNSTATVRAPGASIRTRVREKQSPLHPDEILGVPHLIQEMRRLAIDRCREHYCRDNGNEEFEQHQHSGDDRHTKSTDGSTSIAASALFTDSQQRCLELWGKCVELLVTAGGGGIPLLMKDDCASRPPSPSYDESGAVPYGILHACVCCKVPVPSLVEIALILFPDQVYKRDVLNGMVPLHHVLCAEHKYSYATSNLLAILLKGRASIGSISDPLSPKTARRIKKQQQQQISTADAAAGVVSSTGRIPELPSLSNFAALSNNNSIDKTVSSLHLSNARYLQSTALLSFPSETSSSSTPNQKAYYIREHKGPIPLVFAIRKGLSMANVINKLLEADSHESLRILDPISQLPPFALVATKVHHSKKGEQQQDPSSDDTDSSVPNHGQRTATATMISTTIRSRRDHPNDIIAAAIGSTINALSSGDGSSKYAISSFATFSPSVMLSSSEASNSSSSNNRNPKVDDSTSAYTLDDVYRLLLAHPQVLAQYVV